MSEKKQQSIIAPDNYLELCKPFESTEAADAALKAFWDEFYELRNKHRLPDVHVTVRVAIKDRGDVMTTMHAGSELLAESMCAWAFGRASGDRQEMISRIVGGHGGIKRRSKE